MNPKDFKVDWLPEAKKLLEKRDRFTRVAIVHDFNEDPEKDAIPIDAVKRWYATPVANNRYTVIWRSEQMPDMKVIAHVKAVVASQLKGENQIDLKDKLERVANLESNGLMTSLF